MLSFVKRCGWRKAPATAWGGSRRRAQYLHAIINGDGSAWIRDAAKRWRGVVGEAFWVKRSTLRVHVIGGANRPGPRRIDRVHGQGKGWVIDGLIARRIGHHNCEDVLLVIKIIIWLEAPQPVFIGLGFADFIVQFVIDCHHGIRFSMAAEGRFGVIGQAVIR